MSFLNDIDKHLWKAKINVGAIKKDITVKLETQGTQDENKKTQHNMCWTPLMQTNTNNVNKTCALLQTTGDRDEPNIVFMRKS